MPKRLDGPEGERIAKRLRELRLLRRLTQEQLAEMADTDVGTLSRLENGRTQPSLEMLARLVSALGTTMGDVLDPPVDGLEAEMLARFRRLSASGQSHLVGLLRSIEE